MGSGEPGANVADLVGRAATDHPHRPALIEAASGQTITWTALDDRVGATAGALVAAGVAPGEPVAVVMGNSIAFAAAYWGALRAGAVVVPVNPAYTPPEIAHLLTDSGAATVVVEPGVADTVRAASDRAGRALRILRGDARGLRTLDAGDPGAGAAHSGAVPGPPPAVLCYTSGTTGRPKGARLTHANLLANLEAFSGLPRLSVAAHDVLLGVLPFFHVFGLNVVLNAAARRGACVLAVERFTPHGSLTAAAEHGVTVAYGAPPVFAAWNAVPADQLPALRTLRAAVSGADALAVSTWQRFADCFGVAILEGYGLTETAPVLASNACSPAVRPGTVGHPLPGVTLRIVDPSDQDVATGTVGEILARGPNVFDGYHGQPEATAAACRGGWFHTGDLGSFDPQGYLTIAGRLTNMIIVSGFNVYPREVEDALVEHPGVAEAGVVGVPDARTGERVHAVVVPEPGWTLDTDELLTHCRARLARYKLPRHIAVVAELPRLATGKLARDTLRRRAPD